MSKQQYVTEEKLQQANQENLELGGEFLEYLSSIGRSKETIKQYANDLKILWVLLLEKCKNKFFVDLSKRDIIRIQNYLLNEQGLSPARIRRFRSAASSLSNYIENILDEDYPQYRAIINKIQAPVLTSVREIDYFDFDFAKEIAFKLIEEGKIQPAFFLMMATASGARKAELLRLKMSDIEEDKLILGSLYKSDKIKTKGRGEHLLHKYTIKSLIDEFIPIYKEYREKLGVDTDYIFFRKYEGKYCQAIISTADSMAVTIDNCFREKHYHPHASRHTYVTELLKLGLPLEIVQQIVGHKSSQITAHYSHISTDDRLADFFKDGEIISNSKGLGDI